MGKTVYYRCQTGFSLVELMVSMLIATVVLGGVISVVQTSRATFLNEQEASFIQENARYAVEVISRDIRLAGSFGCADMNNVKIANIVDGDLDGLYAMDSIDGFEGTVSIASFPTVIDDADVGSDAIVLRYADPDTAIAVSNHQKPSSRFALHTTHDFDQGDKLVVVDSNCRHMGVFENTSTSNATVEHQAAGTSPGNCTNEVFADNTFDCSAAGASIDVYNNGSVIMAYVANAYYISDSNVIPTMPALKRRVLTESGYRSEELAQGVESMELLFGSDTDAPADGNVDVFLNADDVPDWDQVIAVRFSLVFRSQSEVYDTNQTVTLNGTNYTDRYLRQLASATVQMRNR